MILKSGLDVGFSVDWRCKNNSQNEKNTQSGLWQHVETWGCPKSLQCRLFKYK